eukprot:7132743-Prymnesium_polylepis.1
MSMLREVGAMSMLREVGAVSMLREVGAILGRCRACASAWRSRWNRSCDAAATRVGGRVS